MKNAAFPPLSREALRGSAKPPRSYRLSFTISGPAIRPTSAATDRPPCGPDRTLRIQGRCLKTRDLDLGRLRICNQRIWRRQKNTLAAFRNRSIYAAALKERRMPYVVRWVPRGPDMMVSCHTMADVIELTRELKSSGRGSEIHVLRDDVEIDVDSLLGHSRDDSPAA